MHQGGGWRGFHMLSFADEKLNHMRRIVPPNSEQATHGRALVLVPEIPFAPIVKLSKIQESHSPRQSVGGSERRDCAFSIFLQTQSSNMSVLCRATIFTPCPSNGRKNVALRMAGFTYSFQTSGSRRSPPRKRRAASESLFLPCRIHPERLKVAAHSPNSSAGRAIAS